MTFINGVFGLHIYYKGRVDLRTINVYILEFALACVSCSMNMWPRLALFLTAYMNHRLLTAWLPRRFVHASHYITKELLTSSLIHCLLNLNIWWILSNWSLLVAGVYFCKYTYSIPRSSIGLVVCLVLTWLHCESNYNNPTPLWYSELFVFIESQVVCIIFIVRCVMLNS